MRYTRQKVVATCDCSMPGRKRFVLVERPVGCPTPRMPRSVAEIHPVKGGCSATPVMEMGKSSFKSRHKEKRHQCWKDLIGEVEKDPWGLTFKIVTKRLVTRRKTPALYNPDRVKYIMRSLFLHVRPFQSQDQISCVFQREELFNLEKLKRAGGSLKANTALKIDVVPNEILKYVSEAYWEIHLEAFKSRLREGRFFIDWKKQRLVLLRKGNIPLGDA